MSLFYFHYRTLTTEEGLSIVGRAMLSCRRHTHHSLQLLLMAPPMRIATRRREAWNRPSRAISRRETLLQRRLLVEERQYRLPLRQGRVMELRYDRDMTGLLEEALRRLETLSA